MLPGSTYSTISLLNTIFFISISLNINERNNIKKQYLAIPKSNENKPRLKQMQNNTHCYGQSEKIISWVMTWYVKKRESEK